MKKYFVDYFYLFAIAGLVIFFDQWTKYLVRTYVPIETIYKPEFWLTPYARIMHWHNTGAALGMFQNMNMVFTILAIVVSFAILYYYPQIPRKDWILRLSMGLLLSGAVGNLIDRLHQGYVTDFISIWRFPVFNIADLSITTGVIILALGMLLDELKQKSMKKIAPAPGGLAPPVSEAMPSSEESQGE